MGQNGEKTEPEDRKTYELKRGPIIFGKTSTFKNAAESVALKVKEI